MSAESIVGKIYSVYCEDFVTYVKATIYPGEYLNVIIGPNGSGKSTIVAAIVLGLGGNPKLLSRSSSIEDYIKNGKEKATIEIQIYENAKRDKISFGRTFDCNGKSVYTINRTTKSHKEYLATIAKFHIQINNLCQFLPQDRVQDFAKMNPQEILMNTLTSVCSAETIETFGRLKEMQKNQTNTYQGLKQSLDKLKELENRNAQLKEQIDRMNIRKKLQNEIVICENKKMWLEYQVAQQSHQTVKSELEEALRISKRHETNYDKAKKEVQVITNKKEQIENLVKSEERKVQQFSNAIDEQQNKSEQLENSIGESKQALERKKTEISERKKDLKREVILLSGLVADLKSAQEDLGSEEEIKLKTEELERKNSESKLQHKSLMNSHMNINRQLDDQHTPELHAIKRKIASLENIGDRKLANIRDYYEDVYKAIIWLRQNRNLFEDQVFEPMVLELNVNAASNAKYIESVVNKRDLLAFTCVDKSDMNKLVKHLCNDMGLKVSVLHSDAADDCSFEPQESIENYKKLGFKSYLLEMLSGPAPILNYLCKAYHIHTILAGTEEVDNHANRIPDHIRMYFAGNSKTTVSYSKYSGEKSTMRTDIAEGRLLSVGVDAKEMTLLKNKLTDITKKSDALKNKRSEIELKLNALEEERKEILNEKKSYERKVIVVQEQMQKIRNQKSKIEKLKNDPIDIEQEEAIFQSSAQNFIRLMLEVEQRKVKTLSDYQKASELYNINYTKLQIYKRENVNVDQKLSELKDHLQNSKQLVDTIQSSFDKIAAKNDKIRRSLKERCKGRLPSDKSFPFAKEFAEISDDLNTLNDMILEMQSKVNCMLDENKNIYDEYQSRQTQIDQLRAEIESNTRETATANNQMQEIHNNWLPQVVDVIQTINTSFGKFMSSMDYVGEVQLFRNDEFDYDSFGIQIFVKYRNDAKLQALDRYVQSGGERAVAIAVYTLSLQRITHVPFRCVDEINQGMDSNNERKVFDMLVEETSQAGHSQYFFITPKLLPNLSYNEFMTIHIVHNGSFIEDDKVFVTK